MAKSYGAATASGRQKDTRKRVCSGLSIDIAANGGFSVTKRYRYEGEPHGEMYSSPYAGEDEFVFADYPALQGWLAKTLTK